MPEHKRRRGRPKGTGIDDTETLDAVRRLIAADPGLRPTTAIKQLGFTDPSVVRRLRDKFKATAQRDDTATKPKDRQAPARAARTPSAPAHESAAVMACAGPKAFELKDSAHNTDQVGAASSLRRTTVAVCAANIGAAQSAIAANYTLTQTALKNPFVAFAVYQQLVLQDMALSFFTTNIDRRTLH